jgi:hypothetical protein
MKTLLQILNVVTLLFTIGVNYFFNGQQGKPSIGEISDKYNNLLTPAGYAFGIWGLIYLALIVFAVYQSGDIFRKDLKRGFILQIGWWFIIANLANAAWVWAFTSDQQGLSLLIMLLIFFSLLKIVLNTNMERAQSCNILHMVAIQPLFWLDQCRPDHQYFCLSYLFRLERRAFKC